MRRDKTEKFELTSDEINIGKIVSGFF